MSKKLLLVFIAALFSINLAYAWTQPIGIPVPSFGVNEIAPIPPSPWTSAVAGYYYVDTTGAFGSCSDSNTYGFPATGKARCTIPTTLGPGSYVELHGTQNYDINDFAWTGNSNTWAANTNGPVWVRGQSYATRPIVRGWYTSRSTYVIIENVNFAARNTLDNDYGLSMVQGANNHHIVLRNSEVSGGNTDNSITSNGAAIGVGEWGYSSGSNIVHDIVIDNVSIHDVGPSNPATDVDQHCIVINGKVNNVWVTHNTMARCSGDSMQVEAQQGYKTNIHNIYFGQNVGHDNRQSGGWVKDAQDVVFSQNVAYNFNVNSGGPGHCYGSQYDHDYVWFLFNTCHDSTIAFDQASDNGAASNVYMIGNQVWNIGVGQTFQPYNVCTFVLRQGTTLYVVGNSVYNYVGGLCAPPGVPAVVATDNIFQYRNSASGYDWYDESGVAWTLSNNIFYPQTALATTTSWSSCSNCQNADPKFVSTATPDLHLQSTSPAIDSGVLSAAYATFQSRYGISIQYDLDGNSRPQNGVWDKGAYEYLSGPDTTPPTVSSIASSSITTSGATINWTTNEASDSQVDYGTTTSYGSSTTLNAAMVTSHSQPLTGLAANALYHYRVKSRDAANNLATSADYTFTTLIAADTMPPLLSSIAATGITTNSATIIWTTSEAANATVRYGKTATNLNLRSSSAALQTSQSVALSGLLSGTRYYYNVTSCDADKNCNGSATYNFITLTPDTTAPYVQITSPANNSVVSDTLNVTVTASDNVAIAYVEFFVDNVVYNNDTALYTFSWNTQAYANGLHTLKARAVDTSNNANTSSVSITVSNTVPDTTPPVISNIHVDNVTYGSAIIEWTTNEPSASRADYGLTASYGSFVNSSLLETNHSMTLAGLDSGTPYHFAITSTDGSGNSAKSGDYSFTTQSVSVYTGVILKGVLMKTASAPCANCMISITVNGATAAGNTTMAGAFLIVLNNQISVGSYVADVAINDGTQDYLLKKRIAI